MAKGRKFSGDVIHTETVVMSSVTGTVRGARAENPQLEENSISISGDIRQTD